MKSRELNVGTADSAGRVEQCAASTGRRKRRPNSGIVRLVRGAIDATDDTRSTVELTKDTLTSVATELTRLGRLLDEDRLWDALDVAKYLGISRNSVYAQVDAGRLPCVRLGGL